MTAATTRSARFGLRATPQQEAVLRRAAKLASKSITDFILDVAYRAAEQTLLDQQLFLITEDESQTLWALLNRPEQDNVGLQNLFARRAPWSSTDGTE
jgi:uncharacterized protein (DUF1778 family)